MKLELKDSCLNGCDFSKDLKESECGSIKNYSKLSKLSELSLLTSAIDEMRKNKNQLTFFSFGSKKSPKALEEIISYDVLEHSTYNRGAIIPNKVKIYTSHFVGYYNTVFNKKEIQIVIKPRFGKNIADYLYAHAMSAYCSANLSRNDKSKDANDWLLPPLWIKALEEAIGKSRISKAYKKEIKNLTYFRGRLDIQHQITHNLTNPQKFFCSYSKLSYNTPINRTICKAFEILKKRYPYISSNIHNHIAMLQNLGVQNHISLNEINKITYTSFDRVYKKVIDLSKILISQHGVKHNYESSKSGGQNFFLDMSEVWESYLYKVFNHHLPNGYEIKNGNLEEDYIFEGEERRLYPDFKLYKNGELVAILDAKYKYITCINGREYEKINREDLYQMMSYMLRFNCKNGIFLSPNTRDLEEKIIQNNDRGKIFLCGIDLGKIDKKDEKSNNKEDGATIKGEIEKMEKDMVDRIVSLLDQGQVS